MQVKKTLIEAVALVLAVVALPDAASAQNSSINAFSPYSMYGIGELNTPGALPTRSMGGVGVAMRMPPVPNTPVSLNLLNPASFSAAARKSFLFDFGVEGQNYYNAQKVAGQEKRSAYNTINFHEIGFQFPLAKGLGLGFGLTPYSSVGYRVRAQQIDGNYGWADYLFEGDGDVTEVKAGLGWEVFRNFSIGAAVQYYWGDITRRYRMTPTNITDNMPITPTVGTDLYSVSSFKGQFGFQWTPVRTNRRMLTLGATYDIGGDLQPHVTRNVRIGNLTNTTVKGDTTHLALSLPQQVAVGVFYRTPRLAIGFDYVYQNWRRANGPLDETTAAGYKVAYTNTSTYKFGVEYTPNYTDLRRFMNRISYRAGVRFGGYNQTFGGERISQYAVTVGVGIPVHFLSSSAVDVGFEYGGRGAGGQIADRVGFVRQHYFKFSVGFSIFASPKSREYWFVRPKYD